VRRLIGRHWPFGILLALGAALRLAAVLGYRPILWFNDGFEYVAVSLRMHPDRDHPVGYSVFLRALLPFHSFTLVAVLQHAMMLAVAVGVYALLCRYRVPPLLAALASAPLLLSANQVQLEHLVMSDTLFAALLAGGVLLLAWWQRVPWPAAAGAGALLAAAALTRSIGVPLIALGGLYLLARRPGWRPVAAFAALAALPLGAYAGWYHAAHGRYALTSSDGVFLYSRVMSFADCARFTPPRGTEILCDPTPPADRPVPSDYIWHARDHGGLAKLRLPRARTVEDHFLDGANDPARAFAAKAILTQPGAYLRVAARDFGRTFEWGMTTYPNKLVAGAYRFSLDARHLNAPTNIVWITGGTGRSDATAYEHGSAAPRIVGPYAGWLHGYQRYGWLPGPLLAALLVLGLAGPLAFGRRDERRWTALLLWATATGLLAIPPLTAQFDYRYVLPAIPFACAAAFLSLAVLTGRPAPESAALPDPGAEPEPDPPAAGSGPAALSSAPSGTSPPGRDSPAPPPGSADKPGTT
jgi:hypothetical protein